MDITIHYQEKPEIPSAKIHGEPERYRRRQLLGNQ